ncbi:hypothetical protein QCA50_003603 [Cerrena zonata]|uniref:Uncharacterized protein n=1 Tax=Cerrena zonata TaxID=2478898 RepID=A0AAW0GN05_9APHY
MDQAIKSSGLVVAAIIGAWFWDLVMSIPETVQVYTHRTVKLPDVVYFLSRVTSGGFFLTAFIYLVAPIQNCQSIVLVGCWFAAFALPLNCMLFLFRIWGVFLDSRFIPPLFSILWLSTCSSFIAPFTFKAAHMDHAAECFIQWVGINSLVAFVAIAVYDTLVFIAISCKLLTFSYAQDWKARIRLFFCGENMGYISKGLLQSGQIYYLISICGNFLVVLFFTLNRIPPSLKVVFAMLNIAVQNAMACRVFRYLRLGFINSYSIDPSTDISLPRFNSDNEAIDETAPLGNTVIGTEGSSAVPDADEDKFEVPDTENRPSPTSR